MVEDIEVEKPASSANALSSLKEKRSQEAAAGVLSSEKAKKRKVKRDLAFFIFKIVKYFNIRIYADTKLIGDELKCSFAAYESDDSVP
jgi:hypothetical protein